MPSRKRFAYSEESMKNALRDIRENNVPVATACKQYNVPRTSVRNRLAGKTADDCRRVGPTCALGPEIEQKLASWILDMANRGFPINKDALIYSVQKLIDEFNIKSPLFVNKTPGRKWFDSFMRRNPQISKKNTEFINKARAATNEDKIRRWFSHTREFLGPDGDVLNDPKRIFNMDETTMSLSPKGSLVLEPKEKGIYDITGSSEEDNITTLITVNAEGLLAPPVTIFKFQHPPENYVKDAPKDWGIGISETGWMQSKQFFEYFANVFIKFLDNKNIPRPIIVFLDGHASHLSLNLSNLCQSNGIILICLPPNTTHILQPLKQAWKEITRRWLLEHEGRQIEKKDVPSALNTVLTQQDFTKTIVAGFRTCGLYPFDDNAPNFEKCVTKSIKANVTQSDNKLNKKDNLDHFSFLENKIDPVALTDFYSTFSNNSPWEGEERYLELYNLWKSIKETIETISTRTSPTLVRKVSIDHSINSNNQIPTGTNIEYIDFPEFMSCTPHKINDFDVQTSDFAQQDLDDNNLVDGNSIRILQNIVIKPGKESSQECQYRYSVEDKGNINEYDLTENTEKEEDEENMKKEIDKENMEKEEDNENMANDVRLPKKRSISETLRDIVMWPEKTETNGNGKTRKKRNFPSIITSDEWIELMEAKGNEKKIKVNTCKVKLPRKKTEIKTVSKENTYNENDTEYIKEKSNVKVKTAIEKTIEECIKVKDVEETTYEQKSKKKKCETMTALHVGSYVIAKYDNEFYPVKIVSTNEPKNEYYCCAMKKSGENWKWPDKQDLLWYEIDKIVMKIEEPKPINTRGVFYVPEMKLKF